MKKKAAALIAAVLLMICLLAGCGGDKKEEDTWQLDFDTSLPTLAEEDGWVPVLLDDFTATEAFPEGDAQLNPKYWTTSPHGLRNIEYWCDQMVEVKDGTVMIHSERQTDHSCEKCVDKDGNPVKEGIFTGGIEGRRQVKDAGGSLVDESVFSQAFGYFETRVKVPTGKGMWSAFWLQSSQMGKIGNKGRDGSEIDVYESAFGLKNKTQTGNAIHYDGYGDYHQSEGSVAETGRDLYDGQYHTYALKWTPWEYVFFVDGSAVWATDFGGVSNVPEFLRLTVEIRDNGWGPYGQHIEKFENADDGSNDFVIDYVKVYQNRHYEPYIRSDADYAAKS